MRVWCDGVENDHNMLSLLKYDLKDSPARLACKMDYALIQKYEDLEEFNGMVFWGG